MVSRIYSWKKTVAKIYIVNNYNLQRMQDQVTSINKDQNIKKKKKNLYTVLSPYSLGQKKYYTTQAHQENISLATYKEYNKITTNKQNHHRDSFISISPLLDSIKPPNFSASPAIWTSVGL